MEVNPILVKHLHQARQELLEQRASIEADIRKIDMLLTGGTPTVSVEPKITMDVHSDGRAKPPEEQREGSVGHANTGANGSAEASKQHYVDKRVADLYEGKSGTGRY